MAKKSKKVPFDPAKDADVEALADRIITASVLDKSLLPIVGRILDGTAGLCELPDDRKSNTAIVADVRTGMRHASSTFPSQLKDARGLGKLIPGGNVPPAAQPAPPPVAPAVAAAPAVAPVPAPVAPVAPAPGPAVQPIVVAPAPAGAAAPAGGQVFSHRIARKALDWVVDKIANMRSPQRQLLLQEVAREQARGMPLRQPDPPFRRWPRHITLALSDMKLMASLNANYQADAIIEIDAAIPAPVAAPVPAPPPVAPVAPVVAAPAPVVAAPAPAVVAAPVVAAPPAGPVAPVVVAPAPAVVAAPVVAAPAGNTDWSTAIKWAVGILALIGALWLSGQFVSAFFTKLVTAEAKEQISQRDRQIERLNETVRVLRGDVSTAIEARDLALNNLGDARLQLGQLRHEYNVSDLAGVRRERDTANAELDDLRPEAASLRVQVADAGRKAKEAAAAHTTQVRGLEQRIAALVSESEQMNGLIRQLQDPSNIGAPCDVDILTLNISEGSNTTLRIRRWGEDRDQSFTVPGAGDRQIGRCTRVYNTSGGVHLFSVGGIQRQKLIVPADMTVYVRYGTSGRWQPLSFNRATILVIGGDASLEYRNPDLAELAARR